MDQSPRQRLKRRLTAAPPLRRKAAASIESIVNHANTANLGSIVNTASTGNMRLADRSRVATTVADRLASLSIIGISRNRMRASAGAQHRPL